MALNKNLVKFRLYSKINLSNGSNTNKNYSISVEDFNFCF